MITLLILLIFAFILYFIVRKLRRQNVIIKQLRRELKLGSVQEEKSK